SNPYGCTRKSSTYDQKRGCFFIYGYTNAHTNPLLAVPFAIKGRYDWFPEFHRKLFPDRVANLFHCGVYPCKFTGNPNKYEKKSTAGRRCPVCIGILQERRNPATDRSGGEVQCYLCREQL